MSKEDGGYLDNPEEEGDEWKLIGRCAVDSGHLIVSDPSYLDNFNYREWSSSSGDIQVSKTKEEAKANLTKEVVFSGIAGTGVVFQSGLGDGTYNVYAKIEDVQGWGPRVTEVKIKLL